MEKRTMWWVVLYWKSFPMVSTVPCTKAEAEQYCQAIWPGAYCE